MKKKKKEIASGFPIPQSGNGEEPWNLRGLQSPLNARAASAPCTLNSSKELSLFIRDSWVTV